MKRRSPRLVLAFALVSLALVGTALGEESARNNWQQALDDLRTRRDQATEPPVLPHLRNAVSFAEGVEFADANHVSSSQSLDGLRQATNSATEATRESLRAGNVGLAEALKADCLLLAEAARRLANALVADAQAVTFPINSTSAAARDADIAQVATEIARGDALVQDEDNSFRRYNPFIMVRANDAIARYKSAYLAARDAARFRLGLSSVSLGPSLFSPNGDGRRESVRLTAQLVAWDPVANARARVECAVLNAAGATIRTIVQAQPIPAGAGLIQFTATLDWDGRDSAGVVAAEGAHTLRVGGAYLPPGGAADPLNGTLSAQAILDLTPPAVEISVRAYSNNPREPIAGTWSDPNGVVPGTARILVGGDDLTSAAQLTGNGFAVVPPADLSEGTLTVEVRIQDAAENEQRTTATSIQDRTPPEWRDVDRAALTRDRRRAFGATVFDALSGTGSYSLSLDGSDVTSSSTLVDGRVAFTPSSDHADGPHVYAATLVDRAGNSAALRVDFTVDTTAPVVSISVPRYSKDARQIVEGTWSDLNVVDPQTARIVVDGVDVAGSSQLTAAAFSFTPTSDWAEGNHTFVVRASDLAGNVGEATASFVEDRTPPSFSNARPTNSSWVRDVQPRIQLDLSEALSGIVTVQLFVRGLGVTDQAQITETSISYTPADPLSDGQVDVRVVAVDGAQNINDFTWIFSLDSTAPAIVLEPADGSVTTDHRQALSATLSDAGSGVVQGSVRAFLDGVDVTAASQITERSVSFTPAEDLPDGNHTYRVVATDNAGNAGEASSAVNVVSAYVNVDFSTGGTAIVGDTDSPIFGAAIEIPAGAAPAAETVTIAYDPDPLPFDSQVAVPTGPAVNIDAPSDFLSIVDLWFPYDEAAFNAAGLSEDAAVVLVWEEGTDTWVLVDPSITEVDQETNRVRVRRFSLSVFRVGYLIADPTQSTVTAPSTLRVNQNDLIVVTPRTANGAFVGRGHNVEVRIASGGGTVGQAAFQQDGTYVAQLTAPTTVGSATIEAFVDGAILPTRPIVTYLAGQISRFSLSAAPASVTAGGSFDMTLTALDEFGNVATSYAEILPTPQGTDPGMVVSPDPLRFRGGVLTFTVEYRLAGPNAFQVEDSTGAFFADSSVTLVDPDAPSLLVKDRGNDQRGTVGTTLVESLRAKVVDRFNNGLSGLSLVFVIDMGDGTISETFGGNQVPGPIPVLTNENGEAEVFLTLGATAGENRVKVSSSDTGTSETFVAFGDPRQAAGSITLGGAPSLPVGARTPLLLNLVNALRAPLAGQDNNLSVRQSSVGPPMAEIGFVQDLGGGNYSVEVQSSLPGTVPFVAYWDDPDTAQPDDVASSEFSVYWFDPTEITVTAPQTGEVGMELPVSIRLMDTRTGTGVTGQAQFLALRFVSSLQPEESFIIGGLTEDSQGGGQYTASVRSLALGSATFEAVYDLLDSVPSPDLPAQPFTIQFVAPPPGSEPYVAAMVPSPGATGVAHNATIRVSFDRVMDTRTITRSGLAVLQTGAPASFAHLAWLRFGVMPDGTNPRAAYNAANGETRVACGDLDGDGRDEIVVGMGAYGADGGWVQVIRDSSASGTGESGLQFVHEAWIRVPWAPYNAANGETRPACGDLDRDGRAEIVVGLGPYPTAGGWLVVFDDQRASFAVRKWVRVPWAIYNNNIGATRPACGDIDGDLADEIIIGLDHPANVSTAYGPGGWFELRDDLNHDCVHFAPNLQGWGRVKWSTYNQANGETRPACGDVDSDGRDEVVIGLGRYPNAGGWLEVFDDVSTSVAPTALSHLAWIRITRGAYNAANGESWPACGDIDGDGADEIAVGTGTYTPAGGYVYLFQDKQAGNPRATPFAPFYSAAEAAKNPRVAWSTYNAANGETRPAIGNVIGEPGAGTEGGTQSPPPPPPIPGDSREEIVVGLGTYATNGGWVEVRGPSGSVAGVISFETEVVGDVTRTVAVFRPEQQLAAGVTYEVHAYRGYAFDLQGRSLNQVDHDWNDPNDLGSFKASFTVNANDTYPPSIMRISPADGEAGVSPQADIVIEFSEPLNPASNWMGSVILGRVGFTIGVEGTKTLEEGNRIVRFRPATPLVDGGQYFVRVLTGILDTAGNRLLMPLESQFTVLDTVRPLPPVITTPPAPSPTQRWRESRITFAGTAEPLSTISFYETGGDGTALATASVGYTGTFSVQVPDNTRVFWDGPHTVYAIIRDREQNASNRSNEVTVFIDTQPPPPPTRVMATAGLGYVDVSWTASAAGDVLGYFVERSTDGGQTWANINPVDPNDAQGRRLPIRDTHMRDADISVDGSYKYRVKACDVAEPETAVPGTSGQ